MNAIEIRDLTAGYGGEDVIAGLNLGFPGGRFTAIVGPNGSGKTTLFRCVTASLRVGPGHVWIAGKDVCRYNSRELARTLAVVPQRSYTEYAFSVEDIVAMGRYAYCGGRETPADRAAVERAMEVAGVLALRGRNAAELSGGEWQRVVIARAFAQEPRILLMDEPVNSLDINHQVGILNMVRRLTQQSGMTVVCVLHDLNLALHYADHAVLLKKGAVVCQGPPQDVLTPERILDVYQLPVTKVADNCLLPVFELE